MYTTRDTHLLFRNIIASSKAWALAIGANMAEVVASKLKLLHLARIFERETDDDHGLTAPQILSKIDEIIWAEFDE